MQLGFVSKQLMFKQETALQFATDVAAERLVILVQMAHA